MTELLCRADPGLLEFGAQVVERVEHDGQQAVVLDRTAFYPEGGGQPWDTGRLDEATVTAVIEVGGRVLHVVDRQPAQQQVRGRVDAARRLDHLQQHHGQHLLSRALEERCGARTTAFHLGSEDTTIDLHRWIAPASLADGLRRANEVIREARPVRVRTVSRSEAAGLGCKLPEDAGDGIRLVEVDGFDLQPCSGTHPALTSEVGVVLALELEKHKGGARLHFVCGERALRAFDARQAALTRLGTLLSAPLDGLEEAARKTLEERDALRKHAEELLSRALLGDARQLIAEAGPAPVVIARACEGLGAAELRTLAQHLTSLAPCVALLGARAATAQVVFARSAGLAVDIGALLQRALQRLGGRGGGRGDVVQGGGPSLAELEPALEEAARAAREALAGKA